MAAWNKLGHFHQDENKM